MRNDKYEALRLRKSGKTYLEIHKKLGIPKSTLSTWLHNEVWSKNILIKNTAQNTARSTDRLHKMNLARALMLKNRYAGGLLWAKGVFGQYCDDPLFVSALMLYMGEGDKSMANHVVRITNIDPRVLKIFALFLEKYCAVPTSRLRAWILLYPDLDMNKCLQYWSTSLGLTEQQFYKSQVIEGRGTRKKLHYGVGTIIIGDKLLKVKILCWIELLSDRMIENAGMV